VTKIHADKFKEALSQFVSEYFLLKFSVIPKIWLQFTGYSTLSFVSCKRENCCPTVRD